MIYFSLVPPVIRRKSSSASAGGGSPGSKSLHLSPLSNNSERHPRKSQTLFTFPDPGPLSAGSGTRDIYNIKLIVQVSMWACKKPPKPLIKQTNKQTKNKQTNKQPKAPIGREIT
jgi:hypothetical protein